SAATTTGGCLGAGLDSGEVGAAIVDCRTDRTLADVMAGTDGRGGGQGIGTQRRRAFPTRQDQAGRVGGQGDAVLGVLQQGVVVTVVADQHRAEHLLAICRHHQPAIAGGGFVNETITDSPGQRTVRVTNGADIHAQQLELGGHVGTEERLSVLFAQLCSDATGHLKTGCHQAEYTAVPGRALADCIDIGVTGATVLVDCNTATRAEFQFTLASQSVLRADTGREHDQIGFQKFIVGEVHAIAVLLAVADRLCGARQVYANAQRFDTRFQGGPAVLVQLHRHQARGELDNMSFQAKRLQCVGRFKPEQTTADYHATASFRGGVANGVQVLKRAIDQPRVALCALDRRYEREGAGGQDQLVVAEAAFGSDDFMTITINLQHRYAQVQRQARLFVDRHFTHGQRLGIAAGKVFGQMHAVVGTLCFFAKYMDAITLQCAACDQLLDAMVPDHAITDDDQGFYIVHGEDCGVHSKSRPRPIRFFEAKKKAPGTFRFQ
ncbi:Cellobiohydrolase A, partial [Pseudomonas savastanoi pv. glycinea]